MYGLTKNHGGSLDVDDAPNSSSTFGCESDFQMLTCRMSGARSTVLQKELTS